MAPSLSESAYPWRNPDGESLSCREKLVVLDANMRELRQQCQDVLDDALLMGCSHESARAALQQMLDGLAPTVKERR